MSQGDGTGNPTIEVSEAQVESIQEMNRNLNIGIERMIEQKKIEQERLKISGDLLEQRKVELDIADGIVKKLQAGLEEIKKTAPLNKDSIKQMKDGVEALAQYAPKYAAAVTAQGEAIQDHIEQMLKLKEGSEERLAAEKKLRDMYKEMDDLLEESGAKLDDASKNARSLTSELSGVAKFLGISAKHSENVSGKIYDMIVDLSTADNEEKIENMGKALFNMVRPLNLITFAIDKFFRLAIDIDNAGKAFQSATGFTGNFNEVLNESLANTAKMGATIADQSAALKSLADNYTGFEKSNDTLNAALMENVVTMSKFGVTMDTTAENINFFDQVMGMGTDAAMKMSQEVVAAGNAIDVSLTTMAENLKANQNLIAEFGSQGIAQFKDLAAQSKLTGMAMGDLIKVAENFDTFADAATHTAKLNAVLGTNLSAVGMINASHSDRINMLREEINFQVGAFDNLDRYTKKLIAQQMGVSSVAEAQRLLNMDTGKYLEYQNNLEDFTATQEELAQVAMKFVPVLKQIEAALNAAFAENPDLIKNVTAAVQALVDVVVFFVDTVIPVLLDYWPLVIGGFILFKGVGTMVAGVFAVMSSALGSFIASSAPAPAAATTVAGAIKLIGAAIGAAGKTALVGAKGLLIAAGAFTAIGVAASLILPSLVEMLTLIIQSPGALLEAAAGFAAMSASFSILGGAALLAILPVTGLLAVLTGFLLQSKVLDFSSVAQDLVDLGNGFRNMGEGAEKYSQALSAIMSLKSTIGDWGGDILMASSEGDRTSIFAGSSDVFNNLTGVNNVNVKVDMPQLNLPDIKVEVKIDGTLLDDRLARVAANWTKQ